MMFAKKTEQKFGCYCNVFAVWSRSSRWQKASKCKLHIQNLLCSVKVQRTRTECMFRQSRSDIAQLAPYGRFREALPKAKQFYEDERRLLAYDQVKYFCTSILQSFSPLLNQNDVHLLPDETKESMAGLIFAASRIGELKELQIIRSLFVQRFGQKFDKDSVDLRPGNLVSSEIVKILDTTMPQDAITPEIIMAISQKYQTDFITSVDSITEDSASLNNLGNADSDTLARRKKVTKENPKCLHTDRGESQERDRSKFMR
ncbi:unnamed protein product [Brassica rapa]|uniref:Uncharacterized protein n=2 Tax=Brassica TaxID=3705 RepID=A0A3P5ZI93_BRACM|nr:unnamed protein product [Brassica napus]CAG7877481.1 unnamed protein product [Brassica rapa]VDC72501.1 unnamed protein product [Brassica rapa]